MANSAKIKHLWKIPDVSYTNLEQACYMFLFTFLSYQSLLCVPAWRGGPRAEPCALGPVLLGFLLRRTRDGDGGGCVGTLHGRQNQLGLLMETDNIESYSNLRLKYNLLQILEYKNSQIRHSDSKEDKIKKFHFEEFFPWEIWLQWYFSFDYNTGWCISTQIFLIHACQAHISKDLPQNDLSSINVKSIIEKCPFKLISIISRSNSCWGSTVTRCET